MENRERLEKKVESYRRAMRHACTPKMYIFFSEKLKEAKEELNKLAEKEN